MTCLLYGRESLTWSIWRPCHTQMFISSGERQENALSGEQRGTGGALLVHRFSGKEIFSFTSMCLWIAPRRELNGPICNLIRRSFARKTWDRFCALILWEEKRKRSSPGIRFQTDNGIVKQGGNIGQRFHTFLHLYIYITWTIFTIRIAAASTSLNLPQAITFSTHCAVPSFIVQTAVLELDILSTRNHTFYFFLFAVFFFILLYRLACVIIAFEWQMIGSIPHTCSVERRERFAGSS